MNVRWVVMRCTGIVSYVFKFPSENERRGKGERGREKQRSYVSDMVPPPVSWHWYDIIVLHETVLIDSEMKGHDSRMHTQNVSFFEGCLGSA